MYRITKKELVESISVPIMMITKNVMLTHKVKLSRASHINGEREYFHKEFGYRSKYKEPSRATTLRLTHSSILSIENKNTAGTESLIINTTNRDFIVKSLKLMKKKIKQ
jgi:hypothetical protein